MSSEADDIKAAAAELTHAMSQLVRVIDAAGDEGAAVGSIPAQLPDELERLAARLERGRGIRRLTAHQLTRWRQLVLWFDEAPSGAARADRSARRTRCRAILSNARPWTGQSSFQYRNPGIPRGRKAAT